MRKLLFTLFAAAALFTLNDGTGAQEGTTQATADAAASAEVVEVDMDTTRFFDFNNDGVNDIPPRVTREQLQALDQERRQNRGQLMNQAMAGLTKQQKDEIKKLRTNMRRQGATPEQIHLAVGQKVRSFGVDVPEDWSLTAREYDVHRRMTDEERANVRSAADSLRREGRTNAEVRAAVSRKYERKAGPASVRPPRERARGGSPEQRDSLRAEGRPGAPAMRDTMRARRAERDSMDGQRRPPRPERGARGNRGR